MKKDKLIGKIFGIALVFVMLGSMLGGLLATAPPFGGFWDQSQALAASEIIIDVPFKAQVPPGNWSETKNCGQASALMVFCYYNGTVPTEEGIRDIDDWLFEKYGDPINNYNGSETNATKLEALAREYAGFSESYKASGWNIEKVKQEIDKGHPVIVAVIAGYLSNRGYDWAGGHFLVAKGYDDTHIICNDPGTSYGNNKYYANNEFSEAMSAQGGAVVVVMPLEVSPWPMFRHDPQHMGRSPYTGPETPSLKWSYATEYSIGSSPAIGSDGTIYVGGNGVYFNGSHDNKLYAIEPDGTLKWSYATEGAIHSSPAIGPDGTIYVGGDGPGSIVHYLYAINPDGSLKWRYATCTGCTIDSSPAIGSDGTIYVGSNDRKIYAINPDGTLKWSFATGCPVTSSPTIGSDGTIYVGSNDQKIYAINSDGTLKWSYSTGGAVTSSPAISLDGTIHAGSQDNKLYALNPDGTLKWTYTTGNNIDSSPAIDANGTIYIGSYDCNLYAINSDGTIKWSYATDHYISSSPAIGSDGTVYVGSQDGKLYAIGEATLPPTIIYVPDDYPTIQAAVDAASPGDTIIVYPGTYTENVNVNKDHLTIQSEHGAEATIVQVANPNDHVFEVTADYVDLVGFTVDGLAPNEAPEGEQYWLRAGIRLSTANYCIISDNSIFSNNCGIDLRHSSKNDISDNYCRSNSDGIWLSDSSGNTIRGNRCETNNFGIYLHAECLDNTICNNTCTGNGRGGMDVVYASHNVISDNKISGNGLATNSDGIHLCYSSDNIIRNNEISENARGITINDSNDNKIYLNNFIDNYFWNALSDQSTDIWNSPEEVTYIYSGNTYTSYLGNYWSDYIGSDADGDGIGETPYPMDSDADNYPLREPFENYGIGPNNPPNTPSSPSPANHATGVSINADLSWTGGDPDAGDTVTYDVYFGTSSSSPFRATIGPYPATQSAITYDPGMLVDDATYYWQIVARDNYGITREGPLWDFTTGPPSNNPPQLSNPSVQPPSGTPSTGFYYYVNYFDSDGDSPSTNQVYVDGMPYTMSLYSGSASNGVYRYGPKNLSVGWGHNYYFYFEDGKGGIARLPSSGGYSGPTIIEWDPWVYDENSDGIIQKNEALKAVQDYFDLKITKAQVLEVLQLYFS